MTKLTTPTQTLIRVPFGGQTDFQPLALAPGLPMLDARQLTYQVMLDWFGDLLGEPELDDEGVVFYAQHRGSRQVIVERALATRDDLDGPFRNEFEELKMCLFDVRPVSPSERLIFNRLQSPIGNHEGFLYRVLREDGGQQLVWCWGFQRRTDFGESRLCPNPECSVLFLHDSSADEVCPHCEQSFAVITPKPPERRAFFTVGTSSIAAALVAIVGGTFWLSSYLPDLAPESVAAGMVVDLGDLEEFDSATTNVDADADADDSMSDGSLLTADGPEVGSVPQLAALPELFVPFNNLSEVDVTESQPTTESIQPELTFPGASSTDFPNVSALPASPTESGSALPVDLPEPLVVQTQPDEASPGQSIELFEPTFDTPFSFAPVVTSDALGLDRLTTDTRSTARPSDDVATSIDPATVKSTTLPSFEEAIVESDPLTSSKATSSKGLTWHQDYPTGYIEAAGRQNYLLMLFSDVADGSPLAASSNSLFAPSLQPILEQFSRVSLSVNAPMPSVMQARSGTSNNGVQSLLLGHRSFRHLGVRAGIVLVDLTDPESAHHAQVVSAIPLPVSGQFTHDDLMLTLNLPKGSISQRTLLSAIRGNVPAAKLSLRNFSGTLVSLARRNSRYMAEYGQSGPFEQGRRRDTVVQEFGFQADLQELFFVTAAEETIQEAARQAVESWQATPAALEVLTTPAVAMGMDMVRSPQNGRWYVTCFVVR